MTLRKRWSKHVSDARLFRDKDRRYLRSAMRKYGINSFEIKQIDMAYGIRHAKILENFYIKYYQSLCGQYGYNLVTNELSDNEKGEISDEVKNRMSLSRYCLNPNLTGITYNPRGFWVMSFTCRSYRVQRTFKCEREAKEANDRLSILFRKESAKLYFPEQREMYEHENLENFAKQMLKKKRKGKNTYFGVFKEYHRSTRFAVRIKNNNEIKRFGSYSSELEAAIVNDKIQIFLGRRSTINFPELVTSQYTREGASLYNKYEEARTKWRISGEISEESHVIRSASLKGKKPLKPIQKGQHISPLTEFKKGMIPHNKRPPCPIMCAELNRVFATVEQAALEFRSVPKNLYRVLDGKRKTFRGYTWSYIDNMKQETINQAIPAAPTGLAITP